MTKFLCWGALPINSLEAGSHLFDDIQVFQHPRFSSLPFKALFHMEKKEKTSSLYLLDCILTERKKWPE